MSRKFAIIPLSGDLNEVDYNKIFELGFSGYPLIASDGVKRSNAHYLYDPKLIGSLNSKGEHFGYMAVESIVDGVAVAKSAFGEVKFIEIV